MTEPNSNAVINPNLDAVAKAIAIGHQVIAEGKSKVEAVRAMYPLIATEPREVIWDVFVQGAGLTPKGAVTYLYNMIRENNKPKRVKKTG